MHACFNLHLYFSTPLLCCHVEPISTMMAGIAFASRVREQSVPQWIMSAHLCNLALAERVCAAVADCGGPIRVGNGKQLDADKKSLSPALQGVRSSIGD